MDHLTRSQLRRRAKLFVAVWLSWLVLGQLIASRVPHAAEIPVMLIAMVPFVIAGRYGIELWFRAKTTPDLPAAKVEPKSEPGDRER
ncbi:MAG TPA: hypothetical protein VIV40_20365 [Kofleriaceae bacterium]